MIALYQYSRCKILFRSISFVQKIKVRIAEDYGRERRRAAPEDNALQNLKPNSPLNVLGARK